MESASLEYLEANAGNNGRTGGNGGLGSRGGSGRRSEQQREETMQRIHQGPSIYDSARLVELAGLLKLVTGILYLWILKGCILFDVIKVFSSPPFLDVHQLIKQYRAAHTHASLFTQQRCYQLEDILFLIGWGNLPEKVTPE